MRGKLVAVALSVFSLTPAGADEMNKPMTAEQRMQARYPQSARVGGLIGLPVLDDHARTLGFVREIVCTNGRIELIVSYGGLLGWGARPVAVPLEVVGIAGRHLTSLVLPEDVLPRAPVRPNVPGLTLSG
jgi:hypothetical protein